jgi:hypothetical protein
MISFRKNDVEKLIAVADLAQRRWEAAKSALAKLEPRWLALQEELEIIEARRDAFLGTGSHEHYEPWRAKRESSLTAMLIAKIDQRDTLLQEAVTNEVDAKKKFFQLGSMVGGSFASWAGQVAAGLPEGHPLKADLEGARRRMDEMFLGSMADIVSLITGMVDRVENDESVDAALFKFARIVSQALGDAIATNPPAV